MTEDVTFGPLSWAERRKEWERSAPALRGREAAPPPGVSCSLPLLVGRGPAGLNTKKSGVEALVFDLRRSTALLPHVFPRKH